MAKIAPRVGMTGIEKIEAAMAELAQPFDSAFRTTEPDLVEAYRKVPELAAVLDPMALAFNKRSIEVSKIEAICIAKGYPVHRGRYFSAQLPNNIKLRVNRQYDDGTTSARNANKHFMSGQMSIEGMEPPTEVVVGRQMDKANLAIVSTVVTVPLGDDYAMRMPLSTLFPNFDGGVATDKESMPRIQTRTKTTFEAKAPAKAERPAIFVEIDEAKDDEKHG